MREQYSSKAAPGGITGSQKIEIPTDEREKARLMSYHGVSSDSELRLALYRDILRKQRNQRSK